MTETIYLNTAACGLVSEDIAKPGIDFIKKLNQNASVHTQDWLEKDAARIKKTVADFIEAPVSNIALIPNFSFGINGIVQSLSGKERILLYDKDYPSLTHPFEVNNFDIEWFSAEDNFTLSPTVIEKKLKTQSIDLFVVSHAQWLSGSVIHLKEIVSLCHQYNVQVIVDVTQTLGANPISVKEIGVDVLIASNYKWMNAGFGTGIIYISEDFLKKYPPVIGGVNSFHTDENGHKQRTPSVSDFEPGHPNMTGFYILEAAIQDKFKRGVANIADHNYQLTKYFVQEIESSKIRLIGPYNMDNRGSYIVLKDENGLGEWLTENNFIVTRRFESIRLGFHYYNTKEEVNLLIQCIRKKYN